MISHFSVMHAKSRGGHVVSKWHCYLLLPGLLLAALAQIWVLHECHAAKEQTDTLFYHPNYLKTN
jgi:hypothetical protein